MRWLILSLLLAVGTVNAYEIEIKLTWLITGGKIGSPEFEFDASEIKFKMSSLNKYSLDIGGGIEFNNGAWKVKKIYKSNDIKLNFVEMASERRQRNLNNIEWLRSRMERHIPHKDTVGGSIPLVATKPLDADIIRKLAKRWQLQ